MPVRKLILRPYIPFTFRTAGQLRKINYLKTTICLPSRIVLRELALTVTRSLRLCHLTQTQARLSLPTKQYPFAARPLEAGTARHVFHVLLPIAGVE